MELYLHYPIQFHRVVIIYLPLHYHQYHYSYFYKHFCVNYINKLLQFQSYFLTLNCNDSLILMNTVLSRNTTHVQQGSVVLSWNLKINLFKELVLSGDIHIQDLSTVVISLIFLIPVEFKQDDR